MHEQPLLLPAAKLPTIVYSYTRKPWHWVLIVVWFVFAVIGFANILGHISENLQQRVPATNRAQAVGPGFAFSSSMAPHSLAESSTVPAVIVPARIQIKSIGVDAKIEQVGVTGDGSMDAPSSFSAVGWYKYGSRPGERGNAVLDGHVNNALTSSGVFEHLSAMRLGDHITVSDEAGTQLDFVVDAIELYKAQTSPEEIFMSQGPSRLVLITCDGLWDQAKKQFTQRLVVFASQA